MNNNSFAYITQMIFGSHADIVPKLCRDKSSSDTGFCDMFYNYIDVCIKFVLFLPNLEKNYFFFFANISRTQHARTTIQEYKSKIKITCRKKQQSKSKRKSLRR